MIEKTKPLFLLGILFCLVNAKAHAQTDKQSIQDSLELYNPILSSKEMKEDLEILRNIHEQETQDYIITEAKAK